MRLISPRLAARTIAPDRPRGHLPFSARELVEAAVVAALLLGATLPIAQHAGAQVESAVGWLEQAPSPGDASTEVVLDGTDLPAGAPTVGVDAVIVPYDPNAQEQIEPANVPAGGTAPD